ncbi:uncharacterized protein [Typha latifolia]|uniref:uncharacterized protein n=1 Tax=Typha latifolia TaxID=4733 RepID=UPI003C2BFA31
MQRDKRETALLTTGGGGVADDNKPTTSLRQWSSGLKLDPRIVRVSRAFGGKDRHSKVRTIRGLRDRRVRLSVPTAIQLYDLQHRLGLNQPSKVVDWLLDAAQHEIDHLPPLQLPPQVNFSFPHHQSTAAAAPPPPEASSLPLSLFSSTKANDHHNFGNQDAAISDVEYLQRPLCWNSDLALDQKTRDKVVIQDGKEAAGMIHSEQFAANHYPAGLVNNAFSYASYYHHSSELEVPDHCSTSQLLSLAPRSQLVYYHADEAPPLISASYMTTPSSFDAKELNHFPIDSFGSQHHSVEFPDKSPPFK